MWQVDNRTPFATASSWVLDAEGNEIWVVAVKATYDIAPDGQCSISATQSSVLRDPVQGEKGEPLFETDLGHPKPNTDILLLGRAHAPGGEPVKELSVGFRVGDLVREARVYGDRKWEHDAGRYYPGEPKPFVSMSLDWSRCFGGSDSETGRSLPNPVGCGLATSGPLPNVEHSEQRLRSLSDRPDATGFGPVPCHWDWRNRYCGTYDEEWKTTRSPLLPKDFDSLFWQIAPPWQQYSGHLRGGEPVVLTNLTAPRCSRQPGHLRFDLPQLSLEFETRFYNGSRIHTDSCIHTVILETDYPRVAVVHHMSLPCLRNGNKLERTIVTEKQRPGNGQMGRS